MALFFDVKRTDSKAGSWQHAGGMLQPAWLFRRKASPFRVAIKSLICLLDKSGFLMISVPCGHE